MIQHSFMLLMPASSLQLPPNNKILLFISTGRSATY